MDRQVRQLRPRRKTRLQTPIRGRVYDVLRDVPDIRDRLYEPTLNPLPNRLPLPRSLHILDQGNEGACTGFALAAAINLLAQGKSASGKTRRLVSPHMLYAMAKRYDEWPGDKYHGSSLRGALRGFFNTGACADTLWDSPDVSELSIGAAKDARNTSLGAYYRLRPILSDYHAAITETGVILASASVHNGWDNPADGRIATATGNALHAFAIVGYDDEGFWVQNSWGRDWGKGGIAHWTYKDWATNIEDAWVLQLAVPAPSAFGLGVKRDRSFSALDIAGSKRAPPTRADIAGHFVHVQNGDFSLEVPYWTDRNDVAGTAELLGTSDKYDQLVFYAHGGLNTTKDAAVRTAAMTEVFMANRIYPYSVFYDTGLVETLSDIILGQGALINQRTGGGLDILDDLLEEFLRGIGTKLWNEMKADAKAPFDTGRDGETALRLFAEHMKENEKPIHLVGHSTGAVLIGHLLEALDRVLPEGATIDSVSLMAPACTIPFYREKFKPRLGGNASMPVKIGKLTLYCLDKAAELDDTVAGVYHKSLLWLVSNAFEKGRQMPLLGMQEYHKPIAKDPLTIHYAAPGNTPSQSTSHGGFDNDPFTMNDILRSILGKKPERPFLKQDLDY